MPKHRDVNDLPGFHGHA